jgi:DNA-binding NtrC family response regulator
MASTGVTTLRQASENGDAQSSYTPEPGLVLVFSCGRPVLAAISLSTTPVELGREHSIFGAERDSRMSRRHVKVERIENRVVVTDLGSSNGSVVDGLAIRAGVACVVRKYLRLGDSLFVVVPDAPLFERLGVAQTGGQILGPSMQRMLAEVVQLAPSSPALHIRGESGSGKELVSRTFHDAGRSDGGRLVAVNCAAIPEGIAERLIFGARKGAFSGADTDADGYVVAADRGTLFLDEIADLDLGIQAKLLRVIENREVLPVGATKPKAVSLRICSATHQDLRTLVAEKKFREDLFFRLSSPMIHIPPLRERREEIPLLLELGVGRASKNLQLHVSLVESCLTRAWPGNVRELLAEAQSAGFRASSQGMTRVEARHLADTAGSAFLVAEPNQATDPSDGPQTSERQRIVDALRRSGGNIAAAARLLNVHRTQLHRWLARYQILVEKESG